MNYPLGLGELCLKLPVLPEIPGNVIIMLPEEAVLCSHYAQLCKAFHPRTKLCVSKLIIMADYGPMQL